MIRDDIKAALVTAMKGGDKAATGTHPPDPVGHQEPRHRASHRRPRRRTTTLLVTEVLQKMIKQRRESVDLYRKGNREELADAEEAEIAVIERFLPQADERRGSERRDPGDHRRNRRRPA